MSSRDTVASFGEPETWARVLGLITGAIRRRRWSVAVTALLFTLVGCTAAALLPRTYWAEASLLVTKNYVMPALANPKRSVPMGVDVPLQSAVDVALSRQALERIVRSTDLLRRWTAGRPAVMQWKDRVVESMAGPVSDADRVDALVDLLGQRIVVMVNGDVVSVKASWTDRQGALDLTNSVVAAFLEARRQIDVQVIEDAYRILERKAELERAQLDLNLAAVDGARRATISPARTVRVRQRVPAAPAAPAVPAASPRTSTVQPQDDGLGELRARMADVQARRAATEQRVDQRVTETAARLAERRRTLTDRHPEVVALRRALDEQRRVPVELTQVRQEEALVLTEFNSRRARADADAAAAAAAVRDAGPRLDAPVAPARTPDVFISAPSSVDEEAGSVEYARSVFRGSLQSYQDLIARLGDVAIELETAKVAFGYRYAVTQPARLPKSPASPNVPLVIIGALLTGLLAGALRAIIRELQALSLLAPAAFIKHVSQSQDPVSV